MCWSKRLVLFSNGRRWRYYQAIANAIVSQSLTSNVRLIEESLYHEKVFGCVTNDCGAILLRNWWFVLFESDWEKKVDNVRVTDNWFPISCFFLRYWIITEESDVKKFGHSITNFVYIDTHVKVEKPRRKTIQKKAI